MVTMLDKWIGLFEAAPMALGFKTGGICGFVAGALLLGVVPPLPGFPFLGLCMVLGLSTILGAIVGMTLGVWVVALIPAKCSACGARAAYVVDEGHFTCAKCGARSAGLGRSAAVAPGSQRERVVRALARLPVPHAARFPLRKRTPVQTAP